MVYISNLAAGLERGLDRPSFLLEAVAPFEGAAGIELFFHDHDAAYRERLAGAASWLGDLPRTAHGPFMRVEATSAPGSAQANALLDAYRWAFETAAMLGCREMVFHTHQRVIGEAEKARCQDNCRENLSRLIRLGAQHGIRLLIENLGIQRQGVSLFDEEDFFELIDDFPQAGCLIDVGHLNVAGWDVGRVCARLGSRICGYHLHNNDGHLDSHRPIDEGTFDFPAFYAIYRRYTPNAHLTLEYGDGPQITPGRLSADLRQVINGVSG